MTNTFKTGNPSHNIARGQCMPNKAFIINSVAYTVITFITSCFTAKWSANTIELFAILNSCDIPLESL